MKNLFIVANWKSNMTKIEAKDWLLDFSVGKLPDSLKVIVLPPFTLLDNLNGYIRINDIPIELGSQNVSPFENGAYTGEISATQIAEFASYVLIGHSERRINFNETNEMVNKKIEESVKVGLKPIVCVSNIDQVKDLINGDFIIAYEPLGAIGTGKAEDPLVVSSIVKQIKEQKDLKVIYGGSVNADNLKEYIDILEIEGVLIGGKSLNASSLLSIIKNAI